MSNRNLRSEMLRRRHLLGGMASIMASLSGCLSGGSNDGTSNEPTATDSNDRLDSGSGLSTHPSATALDKQPVLGPQPTEAEGVIIEFADPSCPGCARFEENTFPEIKSNLVESGKAAFIHREYPNVAPWGGSASQALEGTFERADDAFWSLKSYYYANTKSLSDDDVLEKTKAYLEQNTDVDASAIVEGVRNDEFAERIKQDLEAGNEAGVAGTPSFFLFRSGSFVTTIEGAQDYIVFKNALGYS